MVRVNLDKVGACASAICAVHCALTGLALGLLSVFGLGFLGNPAVDYIFIGTALFVGLFAVRHGVAKHRSYVPASIFALGILSIVCGHFLFGHDHSRMNLGSAAFSVLGGLLLVAFHVVNWRLQQHSPDYSCPSHIHK